ncbi:MAG: hypothetical protein ABIH22_00385 [Candidatus Margulisiibacteriota bacterium]
MYPRYTKAEITDRCSWTNNFRIILGTVFFVILVLLNLFRIELPGYIFVLSLIGLFVFFYGLLTYYYLSSQKISLNEVIFLSAFLSVMDLLVATVFVYFSGGYQSPAFVAYFIFLAIVPFWAPYLPFSPFFWAVFCSFFYDVMLLLTAAEIIPYISLHSGVSSLSPAIRQAIAVNAVVVPIMLLGFAFGEYMILKYLRGKRGELEEELDHEKDLERRYASFASVFWILTHVLRIKEMLTEALEKMLEILSLRSGMILILDPKKGAVCSAIKGIPDDVVKAICGKQVKEIDDIFTNLQGIFLGKEFIQKELIKKLTFHRKTVGFLILFSKEGGMRISSELKEMLDAVADEMAAAIYYGKLLRRFKTK